MRGGKGGGLSSATSFISLRNRTLKGTVKSNTGLALGGDKQNGDTKSPRAETTNFSTRSCVSFPRDAMMLHDCLTGQCSYFGISVL